MKDYFYKQWKHAEKEGHEAISKVFKEKYRSIVMEELNRPYRQYVEALKQYPTIYLN